MNPELTASNLDFCTFGMLGQYYLVSAATMEFVAISRETKSLLDGLVSKGSFEEIFEQKPTSGNQEKSIAFIKLLVKKQTISIRRSIERPAYVYNEFTLKLIPTRNCNLSCSYCFNKYKTPLYDMTVETAKKSIDFFIANIATTPGAKINIDLTGAGEILLRFDFVKEVNTYVRLLNKEKKYNIFTSLCTNGHLLSEEHSSYLKENHILYGVSLDGDQLANEISRKGIDYSRVVENLKKIRNPQYFGIAATFSGKNHNIIEIFESLYEIGVAEAISIKPVRLEPSDSAAINLSNIEAVKDSFSDFCLWLLTKADQERLDILDCFLIGEDYFAKFIKIILRGKKVVYRCSVGFNTVAIDSFGNILLCPVILDDDVFSLGNIDQGINQEKMIAITDLFADNIPYCSSCWIRYHCAGECFALAYNTHGEITKPVGVMCELNQHLVKLAVYFWKNLVETKPAVSQYLESKYS